MLGSDSSIEQGIKGWTDREFVHENIPGDAAQLPGAEGSILPPMMLSS